MIMDFFRCHYNKAIPSRLDAAKTAFWYGKLSFKSIFSNYGGFIYPLDKVV